VKTLKVNVVYDKNGYVAVSEDMAVCWARGATIDEAIAEYKKNYGKMLTTFKDPCEWDFHVKLKE
jgi:predicted RNase H-like HicB family nuclease